MPEPNLSPFCVCWSVTAPNIEKHKKVKSLISVRNCKKCYLNRGISRWAGLWEPRSAILHCYWCSFVSNDSSLSPQKFIFQSTFFTKLSNKWYFQNAFEGCFCKVWYFTRVDTKPHEAGPGPLPTSKMELLMTILKLTTFSWKLLLQITLSLLLVEVLDLLLAKYDFLICYTGASFERNITYWTIS